MNQTVLSLLKASHTLRSSHLEPPEQPMARNACFMAFLGHFWPPWRTWGQFQWVQMAPTDHPGCIPPRSNQDPLKSSHLETPEPLMAINARFMAFLGHFWPPWRPPGQFRWVQMAPTDHPGCIPPRSNQDPLRSSHLEPPEPLRAMNARFMAFLGHFWPPWRSLGQFRWVQMALTNHPGCIPPRSNQVPLRSSHLETPEPLMAINACFMAFLGLFWPPWRPQGQFWWVQMAPTNHPGCIPPRSN